MKHEKRLAAGERWDIQATGRYIGYSSGAGEIEILVEGEPHLLDVRESLKTEEIYQSFSVRNMTDKAGDFVIKTGTGSLYMAGDGQLTRVTGIDETVNAEVLNASEVSTPIVEEIDALSSKTLKTDVQNSAAISAPIVSKIAELIGSVINIRTITETLNVRQITETLNIRTITETVKTTVENTVTATISGLVTTQEKPATSLASSSKTFTAGESFTITANANRRDVTIMASEDNTDTVIVAGIPLRAGQYVELTKYTGAVTAQAVAANDQIFITEVIK